MQLKKEIPSFTIVYILMAFIICFSGSYGVEAYTEVKTVCISTNLLNYSYLVYICNLLLPLGNTFHDELSIQIWNDMLCFFPTTMQPKFLMLPTFPQLPELLNVYLDSTHMCS